MFETSITIIVIKKLHHMRPRGATRNASDNASIYGTEDCSSLDHGNNEAIT